MEITTFVMMTVNPINNRDVEAIRRGLPKISENFFDIRGIFSSKSPRLARLIPGFVFTYLRRVIHEDQMNEFLFNNRDRYGLEFVEALLATAGIVTKVINPENIPASGRYLVASNHPLGGMDGIALMHVVGQVRPDIIFPVNDLLMNIPNLYELFVPINKHGSNTDNIRILNDAFASDLVMLYFPAGLVSRKQKGKISDLEWKKTFLSKSRTYKRDIVPVHISGRNSDFFYNLANLRKKLRIKANIEMLYLVDEMYNLRDKEIRITFGKSIPLAAFDRSCSDQEWAALLRKHVYRLAEEPQAVFEPTNP
jgi:putative hemolysin